MFEPEVDAALEQLTAQLANAHPDVKHVLEQLQNGELDETTAMGKLMHLAREHNMGDEIARLADAAFGDLRENENGELVLHQKGPAPTVLYPTNPNRPGRLNPLYEAAIAERVQFDGDAPELRTGAMPEGATPAVPVLTTSRSPVAIGMMLETASEEVNDNLRLAKQEWDAEAEQLVQIALEEGHSESTALAMAKEEMPLVPTGVPGYQTGEVPALRLVREPTGSALAAMPAEQRQEAAFKVLSTTQGRRSSKHVIEELVRLGLESEGFPMDSRSPTRTRDVPVYAQWTAPLAGQGAHQPNFSFIDVASKVLIKKLVSQLQGKPVQNPVLEVLTVDTVDDRRVGWAARVVSV
jgi:hypothetical protein